MSKEERTVFVKGLPTDISENRLRDKLFIHFLRKKNGGGEISSVSVSSTAPGTAYIIFEEKEVASRVAEKRKHVFAVNDKKYNISVSLCNRKMHPNELFPCIKLTVDTTKLPERKSTLSSLNTKFPKVCQILEPEKNLCVLEGCYSDVQALCKHLLSVLDIQVSRDDPLLGAENHETNETSERRMSSPAQKWIEGDKETDQMRSGAGLNIDMDQQSNYWKRGSGEMSSYSYEGPYAQSLEKEELDSYSEGEVSTEDFALVVETDIFRYLSKHCVKEYQNILRTHKVEILDVITQDITTLYPQPKKGNAGQNRRSLSRAQQDLARLYQEKQSQLRKEQVPKGAINTDDLEQTLDALRQRLPKLMIDGDKENVYLVGSGSDVSEAKQFLLDMRGMEIEREKGRDPLFVSPELLATSSGLHVSPLGHYEPKWLSGTQSHEPGRLLIQDREEDQWANTEESRKHVIDKKGDIFGDLKQRDDQQLHSFPFLRQESTTSMFSFGSSDISGPKEAQINKKSDTVFSGEKDRDPVLISTKYSSTSSAVDPDGTHLSDAVPKLKALKTQCQSDVQLHDSDDEFSSLKVHKPSTGVKEDKVTTNFKGRVPQEHIMDATPDTGLNKPPKGHESGALIGKVKSPSDGNTHSLPYIKPSMSIHMKPNKRNGSFVAGGSGQSMRDNQTPKVEDLPLISTERKPYLIRGFTSPSTKAEDSTDWLTLHHIDLFRDNGMKNNGTMSSGLARRRTNSFSGLRSEKDELTSSAAKDILETPSRTKPSEENHSDKRAYEKDICVPCKLWQYVQHVYKTTIEDLTSDLQVTEQVSEKEVILHLKGANLKMVDVCQNSLCNLIAKVKEDFDTCEVPLSTLGLTGPDNEALTKFCIMVRKEYTNVKVLLMSKSVVLLGPKAQCERVRTALLDDFSTGMKTKMLSSETKPLLHHFTPRSEDSDTGIISQGMKEDPFRGPGHSSVLMPTDDLLFLTNMHKNKEQRLVHEDKKRENIHLDSQNKNEDTYLSNQSYWKQHDSQTVKNMDSLCQSKGKQSTTNIVDLDNQVVNQVEKAVSESKFRVNGKEGNSVVHRREDPLPLKTCSCDMEGCTGTLCPQDQELSHDRSKQSPFKSDQSGRGIKGTMKISEISVPVPGYIRDTTLKIIYDIPDGIQGDDHPCPGVPFTGGRFEAFLPCNKTTKPLLPLLEKAFNRGLTFTVKARQPGKEVEDGKTAWIVTWGNIPHKTRMEGGLSKNGYPDSNYIKYLTQALKVVATG